jgi:hypothetical protein
MLLLTSTSDIVTVITSAAASIVTHASYVDNNSGTVTPARTNTAAINTATTTTVVASPASGVQRNVKFLSFSNVSGSVTTNVTVNHSDGTNVIELISVALLPSESLSFSSTGVWSHLDSNGAEYGYTVPPSSTLGPTGTIAETMPRQVVSEASSSAIATGVLTLFGVYLTAGQLVSNISFVSGTATFTTSTHYWFGLYSSVQSGPQQLAISTDQTNAVWALATVKTLAMTTAYRVPTSGIYYVAIAMVATTPITLRGNSVTASVVSALAPMLRCTSTTGITTTMPTTGAAVASAGFTAYAYVS